MRRHQRPLALVALALLPGCHLIDDALTQDAPILATHRCEGAARAPGARLVACAGGPTLSLESTRWAPLLEVEVTAALPLGGGAAPEGWIVATADGRLGRLNPGGDGAALVTPPPLPLDEDGLIYQWIIPGLDNAPPERVQGIFRVHDQQLLAVTASRGAWVSADQGASWEVFPWTPRLAYLSGSRPVELRDLTLTTGGKLAFLFYPEGYALAREQAAALLAEGETDSTRRGPRLVTGHLFDQKLQVRSLALGKGERLLLAPDEQHELWLFLSHPARHESTRFASPDWGGRWLDNGYFDLTVEGLDGGAARAALLGREDDGAQRLWVRARGRRGDRSARAALPGDGPAQLSLDAGQEPAVLVAARGSEAIAYNIDKMGQDLRLLWYYGPVGLLFLVLGPLALRRLWASRRG